MNKTFLKIFKTFCWLALAGPTVAAANVLNNPGFESDALTQNQNLLGWTTFGANNYNETGAGAHSGTNYYKMYQAFTSQQNYTGIYQDYISGPGVTYTADGWADILSSDTLAGQNVAWIEVTFRDARANILALYRSALINTNTLHAGTIPQSTWIDLPVTNQYNPNTFVVTNTVTTLVAPPGTYFVRYQVLLQGDAVNSGGSVYFDDLNLNLTSSSAYGSNWNITWSDEFNGTTLNPATWSYNIGNNNGWGNSEMEYYTSRTNNVSVSGGYLNIVAQKESYNGYNFTSARILTQGLAAWKYGRFEWRVRLPAGTGFWPALWFLGTSITNTSWPSCGEIDSVENIGSTATNVQGSLHSGSNETLIYSMLPGDSVTNFHTYALDWTSNAFLWYVDGHLYESQYTWSTTNGAAYPAPFNQPFFMILNLAVGGQFVGYPTTTAIDNNGGFPGVMQMDYVRVYNVTPRLNLSVTGAGTNVLLSWTSNVVAHLQAQFDTNNLGLGTDWTDMPQSTSNPTTLSPASSAYFRLLSP